MKRLLFTASLLLSLGCFAHITEAPKRILTLGIRHESNTFSTALTRLSDFQIKRGADVLKDVAWAKYAQEQGMELIPTVHAYSWPGGVVEKSAFESLKDEILTQIANAGQLDGIYMEMHGALHVQGYEDAQASFIKAIRELVGNQVLISASFDLHGNLSPEFVGGLNLLSGYRTAPHRDIEETKLRAVTMLINALREKQQPVIECITIPILVPGEKSITEQLPLRPIYQKIPAVASQEGMLDASIFAGYCWADLPRSAMRVFVVARDSSYRQAARKQAMLLADEIWDHRAELQLSVASGSFPEMLKKAVQSSAKTIFISDSGDNTTAGAPGDNTQVLEHLIKQKTQNVLLAGIVDPASFETCINLNLNETVQLNLGGKVDYTFSKPLAVTAQVLAKSTPEQIADKRGAVLVEINGIKTVVLNNRRSFTELRDFTELGLDPLSFKVVIVKLGYLFPQLAAIAPEQLMALTDGFCNLDIPRLPYQQVRRPAYPLDTTMQWSAASSVPGFSLHYEGKAATTLVGDGVFIVKTSPEYFLSVKGLDLEGRFHFQRNREPVLPASTLWNTTVFPGGVTYTITIGHDSVRVSYGVLTGAGFTVMVDAPYELQPNLAISKGKNLQPKTLRKGNRILHAYTQNADQLSTLDPASFRIALEAPYRSKLVVNTPSATLNKAVAFSQALLDLSYNGELMYCELFRWLDIWARDLGSGLLPGALLSGRAAMARQSLVYDLNRYALMRPEDCKNSNDPSQGGTASEVGWTVRSIWNYYQYSGSLDSLKKDAAIIRPWVEHWSKRDYNEDGLITDVTDFMDHMIMMLSTNGVQTLSTNAMYASLFLYAGKIEAALGNKTLAKEWDKRYQRTVTAINTRYWNEDKGYFSNLLLWDGVDHRSSQASQAMLLKIGATDAERTRRTLSYLQATNWSRFGSVTITPRMNHVGMDNDQNVKIWPWWNLWEAEARFQHGDSEGGWKLLQLAAATIEDEKYPGLIEETLDTTGVSTGGNVFVTAAGNLIETVVKDLFGIEPAAAGWSKVRINPHTPASWKNYSCQVPTSGGMLFLECINGQLTARTTDPAIKEISINQTNAAPRAVIGSYTNLPVKKLPALKPGKAVALNTSALTGQLTSLPVDQIELEQLTGLNGKKTPYLIVPGNALPLVTPAGKPVKALLENYVSTGGTIVLFGATTHKKTDEDGAGILGEQHGLIDWYNYLPSRTTTPLLNWSFTSTDANRIGTQWQGSYTSKLVLPADYAGKDLHIELGPLVGLDSVFINGAFVASYGDMEKYIVQEYPTNTTYRDTHRYKMLSRYYILNADNPAYKNLPFGKEITIEVRIKGDGLNRGIPAENNASIGVLTTEKKWQPTDEALPGLGLAHSKRKGINYWGSEQFFNSWSTKHGLFGFKVNGNGVQFAHENQTEAALANITVQDIYTDFAVLFPWQFEALAYTTTSASLLHPATTERYPCIVRIRHHNSEGGFVVISPALIQGETGSTILKKLSIIPN